MTVAEDNVVIDLDQEFLGENPSDSRQRKYNLKKHATDLFARYKNILICNVDHVGSKQMQQIRQELRGRAVMLLGKKSILRKVIRDNAEQNPKLMALVPYLIGNIGLCLVADEEDVKEIRTVVTSNQVPAAAKTGVVAPQDVYVGPGSTALDPGQTSFFQALNIATKIVRGSIEIQNRVHLIAKGSKVSASAVALLAKLDLRPFLYGVEVTHVYEDGTLYSSKILDLTDADLIGMFLNGVRFLASVSLGAGLPTAAALPHYIANGFQRLVAIALETEITFAEAEPYKEFLANPDAFRAAAPAAGPAGAADDAGGAAPEPEPETESDGEEFSLFD